MIQKIAPPMRPPVELKDFARHGVAIYQNLDKYYKVLAELAQGCNVLESRVAANLHTTGMPDRKNLNADHDERYDRHTLRKVTRVNTATYTVLATDYMLFVDTDAAAVAVSLPAGTSGRALRIINCGSSGHDVTVVPNGLENLFGVNASTTLNDAESFFLTYETTEGWW